MSHRALVAVARRAGEFDGYLAPSGATDEVLNRLLAPDADLPPGIREGPPRWRARSFDDLLATHLDPISHEALLVVHRDGTVIPHAVLPFVLATADGLIESERPGAVLALVGRDGSVLRPAYVRGFLHGTTGVLGEAVDAGLLAPEEAFAWLADAVRRLAGDRHDLELLPPPH